jgi:PIN domain
MPPSAVVDTSVLVSAFLFPESIPGRVFMLADKGVYTLHFSPVLLEEVKRALRNPRLKDAYGYTGQAVDAWCASLHSNFFDGLIEQNTARFRPASSKRLATFGGRSPNPASRTKYRRMR